MVIPKAHFDAVVTIASSSNKVIGTGFFVIKMKNDKCGWLYLITNKHVLDGKKEIILRFYDKNTSQIQNITVPLIKDEKTNYSVHPNKSVDIAAMHINGEYLQTKNLKTSYFFIVEGAADTNEMIDKGIGEGSFVFSLGYPLSLVVDHSKKPICRMGCIAQMLDKNSISDTNILLDIQNFPGSSGSPVVTRPEIITFDANGDSCKQSLLIGILHSYIPYQVNMINSQTGKVEEIRSENSGLAYMHPVEFIREVVELEYQKKNKEAQNTTVEN